jgi:hypothetical protein
MKALFLLIFVGFEFESKVQISLNREIRHDLCVSFRSGIVWSVPPNNERKELSHVDLPSLQVDHGESETTGDPRRHVIRVRSNRSGPNTSRQYSDPTRRTGGSDLPDTSGECRGGPTSGDTTASHYGRSSLLCPCSTGSCPSAFWTSVHVQKSVPRALESGLESLRQGIQTMIEVT